MKLWLLLLPLSLAVHAVALSQSVILNELFNSSATDEWVELLVVADSVDLRGWDLRDFSSGGAAQQPLDFTSNAVWNGLRAGTLIVIARPEMTITEDLDPSDFLLVIKASNAGFFSGTPFLFAGSSDAIQIRNGSDTHVFGVSWGTSNAASLPQPKVHFTGSSTSNTSISFNEDSVPELTNTAHWTVNNTNPTRGTGNTPTNAAWISGLRARADGSGSAYVRPDTLSGGATVALQVTYRRDLQFTVTDLRILLPPAFIWSRTPADVSYTNMTATLSVSGDTVSFTGITFGADSTVITLMNVTAPESTAFYPIRVQSRVNQYANVAPIPRVTVFGQPVPIGNVKDNDSLGIPIRINELVTVRGIVTVANEFGGPSYIQDNSAGLAIFGSSFSTVVTIGDEVIVSGVLQPFNGLSEIVSPVLHAVVTSGNSVNPVVATAAQIAGDGVGGVEVYEGLLVRLNGVTVTGTGTWQANTNYPLHDPSGTTEIRIDNNTNLVGTPIPGGPFDLIAVAGQFITSPPYIGGYQVLPRFTADVISTGPIIATLPVETNILPSSLAIQWTTINLGTTRAFYGRTPSFELGVVGDDSLKTNHLLILSGLDPATVYYIRAFSVAGTDTSFATMLIASTASAPPTTGEINVYFSKSVLTSLAWFQPAVGNQNLATRVIARINNARRSIDAALYSLSGTPGNDIAAALVNAKNRGVRVRVICEDDNRNTTAFNTIAANGIPLITDRFDPINAGAGLHHNKFFLIDGRGGAPESIWVWTGSWNPTQSGTADDYQNAVEIQDVALANAYTMEFNEMWGSSTEVPNASQSRFGARKTDNTPHRFMIGGRRIESYFSPSDRTTSKIAAALNGAEHSIAFGMLTFTRSDLAAAIVGRRALGKSTRGVLDNNTDQGNQYAYLVANNVDVRLKTGSGLLHHKYALIDAENPYWNSITVTGSHNWSNSAENSNSENTLIIRDGNITNQYLQEFAARYYQFGGTDTIRVSVEQTGSGIPEQFSLAQNYPNPFNPETMVEFQVGGSAFISVRVFDVLGREVATLVHERMQPGSYRVVWNAAGVASGVYFSRLVARSESGAVVSTGQKKMLLIK